MKSPLTSIPQIINLKTLAITALSIGSMLACQKYGLTANFSFSIVGIAVVFPIVFSISEAYKRRENALKYYAGLKSNGRSLFLASRDWMDDGNQEELERYNRLAFEIFAGIRAFFAGDALEPKKERGVYEKFSDLSLYIKSFKKRGLPSGELSRANQYLCKMLESFECMKHIYQYRTPVTLRAYSKLFIFLVSILYGPYFADVANGIHPALAFVTPVLFSFVLVGLDNIQEQLENPFDQVGADDIKINAEKFVESLR